jgi:serine/threonine-protein kinase
MSTKIGHFEILSELAKSASGAVYKANDPQSNQTVALKCIQLNAFGESASDLEKSLLEETDGSKVLSSTNITPVYGAGEIEGQFCAAMEYVQGNCIATMLARKEGFSIWDLLDIGRQVCSGLDYAHASKVYHYSLEPGKIMCGWDGTVKILGFGVSSVGKFVHQVSGTAPLILHYMSPEQVRGEAIDNRSNLFSLGAIFYEMVTEHRAFDGTDAASVGQGVLEGMPVPPLQLSPKLHPLLSDLIMKALHKDPAQRYQSGRELLDDLEKCKESKPNPAKKATEAAKGPVVPDKVKAAVQAKFVTAASAQPPPSRSTPAPRPEAPTAKAVERKSTAPVATGSRAEATPAPRGATVAAGQGDAHSSRPESDSSSQSVTSDVSTSKNASDHQPAHMSSTTSARQTEQPQVPWADGDAPRIAVDPMMAEGGPTNGRGGTSFSEISELPPLKEIYVAPELPAPSVPNAPRPVTMFHEDLSHEEKPKPQPREIAQKAIKEIKGIPPRLILYSTAGAVLLILFIAVAIALHIHSGNSDDDTSASPASETQSKPTHPAQPSPTPAALQNQRTAAAAVETQAAELPAVEQPPAAAVSAKERHAKGRKAQSPAPVVPGQVALDSTPQGAQVQVDGASDPRWVTPLTASGLEPGRHTITISKAGYSPDTRTVDVASGSKSTIVIHLAQLVATLSVTSNPAGASIYVDGRDMGKTTPSQLSVDKGQHVLLVRKLSYLDETTTAKFVPGQAVTFSPTLRPLGDVDSIRTVGKMKKLFGGKGGQAGQATISIRTQPKGAQIAVNQHMLDKGSPVDVMLDPGNYVIDITLSDYAPIHKVVTVEKGNKVVVDETMQRQ